MKLISLKHVVVLGFVTLLSACGGGGGSSSTVAATVPFGIKEHGVPVKYTQANSTATDANGNVYLAGYTTGGLDGNTLTGLSDFFLTKYTATGTWVYTRQMGAAGAHTEAWSVATDVSGNVYVAGDTTGGLDNNTLTGAMDFFLTKYDSNGNRIYTKQVGVTTPNGSSVDVARSVTTDSSGNVYVAGYTNGGIDGNTLMGIEDFFLIKYDATGNKVCCSQELGVANTSTFGFSAATDANGNVYVAGYTTGGLDGNTLMGAQDFFLTKYDSLWNRKYTKQMGVAGGTVYGNSTATDTNGNVYVAGYTNGGLDNNTLTGNNDFFLTKYDASGNKIYTKQLGVAGHSTYAYGTATDASGNVYVAGSTTGGLDGNTLTGAQDFFLTKYGASGTKIYTKQMGVTGAAAEAHGTAIDKSNNVYVAGYTSGGLDGNILIGLTDFFLAKYNSSGVLQ